VTGQFFLRTTWRTLSPHPALHSRHFTQMSLCAIRVMFRISGQKDLSDGKKAQSPPRRGALLCQHACTSNWNPSPCNGHYPSQTTTIPPPRRIHFNGAVHPKRNECGGSHVHCVLSRCLRSPLYAGKIQGVTPLYYPDHRLNRVMTPCARMPCSFHPTRVIQHFGCCS